MFRTISLVVLFNLTACVIVGGILSVMFGMLAGSVAAGVTFPRAIFSMAIEGEPLGVWIIGSMLLTAIWLVSCRWLSKPNE